MWFYCTLDVCVTLNIAFGAKFDRLWYPIVGSDTFLPSCFAHSVLMHSVMVSLYPSLSTAIGCVYRGLLFLQSSEQELHWPG